MPAASCPASWTLSPCLLQAGASCRMDCSLHIRGLRNKATPWTDAWGHLYFSKPAREVTPSVGVSALQEPAGAVVGLQAPLQRVSVKLLPEPALLQERGHSYVCDSSGDSCHPAPVAGCSGACSAWSLRVMERLSFQPGRARWHGDPFLTGLVPATWKAACLALECKCL